jgi:hypothetical protein
MLGKQVGGGGGGDAVEKERERNLYSRYTEQDARRCDTSSLDDPVLSEAVGVAGEQDGVMTAGRTGQETMFV